MSETQLSPAEKRRLFRARLMTRINNSLKSARKIAEAETIQSHEDYLTETRGVDFLTFTK